MFDLGGTVAAHDCNCRCYLEYNLMTAEEFAKATGKKVANDGNTLNINVSDRAMQNYKPVEIDLNNQNTFKRKSGPVTVSRLSNTNNSIYISSNAHIKPKQQHELDKNVTTVLDMLNIKDKSVQPIVAVLTDEEMANNAVAAYSPIQNVVYVRQALLDYDKLPTIQKQLACPNSKYSTLLHEYIHWFDAQRYRTKYGDFNNADDYGRYIARLRRNCKKKLDTLEKKGYDIDSISDYARQEYKKQYYDETYTEYRVVNILGE